MRVSPGNNEALCHSGFCCQCCGENLLHPKRSNHSEDTLILLGMQAHWIPDKALSSCWAALIKGWTVAYVFMPYNIVNARQGKDRQNVKLQHNVGMFLIKSFGWATFIYPFLLRSECHLYYIWYMATEYKQFGLLGHGFQTDSSPNCHSGLIQLLYMFYYKGILSSSHVCVLGGKNPIGLEMNTSVGLVKLAQ